MRRQGTQKTRPGQSPRGSARPVKRAASLSSYANRRGKGASTSAETLVSRQLSPRKGETKRRTGGERLKNGERGLNGSGRPATGVTDWRKRMAVEGRGAVFAEREERIRGALAVMTGEAVEGITRVPFFHAHVARSFGED